MLHSDRLRSLRQHNSYTHQKLAELLGIAVRMVARYEAGEVEPSGDVIARMADVFNVSTDYLLGRTDDPTPCFQAGELSPRELQVITALRRGEVVEAIRVIVSEV